MLRVGIIGAGMVSAHHLKAWQSVANASVVAIADPTIDRAEARAREFHIPKVYSDALEMINSGSIDAVDIASPVETHDFLCRAAAHAGKAILCQKPLATTAALAERLVRDIGSSVRFMVHENWRFRPEYRFIHRLVQSGSLGRPQSVQFQVKSNGLIEDRYGKFPALVRQPFLAALDRLIVSELLVHHLDVLSWLFGPLMVRKARLSHHCPAVRGEDTALISVKSDMNTSITLEGSFADPSASETLADRLEIQFSDGIVRFSDHVVEVSGAMNERVLFDGEDSYAESYRGAIEHFAEAVLNGRPFESSASFHVGILKLVETVYRISCANESPQAL